MGRVRYAAILAAALAALAQPGRASAQGEAPPTVGEAVALLVEKPGQAARAASFLSCAIQGDCNCLWPYTGRYVGNVTFETLSCLPQLQGAIVDYQRIELAVDGPTARVSIVAAPYVDLAYESDLCEVDPETGVLAFSVQGEGVQVGLCPYVFSLDVALDFNDLGVSFAGDLSGQGNTTRIFCAPACYATLGLNGFRFP